MHAQSEVQWGGVVNQVENREGATWIEVIERPLNSNGQPVTSSLSGGRFLAVVPGFLDPTDYRKGRAITVSGNIQGIDIRPFGDTSYDYPKVSVADHQLWVPNNRRLARRGGYYHPHLGKVSLGIGFGRRSSLVLDLASAIKASVVLVTEVLVIEASDAVALAVGDLLEGINHKL